MYCHSCGECFKNLLERTIHEQKEHKNHTTFILNKPATVRPLRPIEPLEIDRRIICLWCNEKFFTQKALLEHIRLHSEKTAAAKTSEVP